MAINQARQQSQRIQMYYFVRGRNLSLWNKSRDGCVFNQKRDVGAIVRARAVPNSGGQKCLFHNSILPSIESDPLMADRVTVHQGVVIAVVRVFWGTSDRESGRLHVKPVPHTPCVPRPDA